MKKIIDFYKVGWNNMNPVGRWVLLILFALVSYVFYMDDGIVWTVSIFFILETVIIAKVHGDIKMEKRHQKYINEKYGDDPEWKKYNELKKKFNNS